MAEIKYTILKTWPALKEDLESFLSDTDAWIISELKKARTAQDWKAISKVIEIMEFLHNMNHSH